jgi:hypothetical protein
MDDWLFYGAWIGFVGCIIGIIVTIYFGPDDKEQE